MKCLNDVSVITSTNGHSLIRPVVSITRLGGSLKVRALAGLLVVVKKDSFSGFKEVKKKERFWVKKKRFLCKGFSDVELVLEQEILEFMKTSRNPTYFPTKKELLDAGRVDLVNAIVKKGGWLTFGWDDDSDSGDENECGKQEFDDIRDVLHTRSVSSEQSNEFASSSGRPRETIVQDDAGIEGILHRLEKYRSLSFGISIEENEYGIYCSNKDNDGHRDYVSANVAIKTYSHQKSGIVENEDSIDKLLTIRDGELHYRHKEMDSNYIKSRLQQMQFELSSVICLLRPKSEANYPNGHKCSSSELQHLSDTWEFQENEIMNAKDRLRSIRAELAVSEGKMALSIIEANKVLEAKQKRIDSACRTLHILHTSCIVWPNSASEVLLAGSFDGWTTQRKMERSQTGIFSLSLKLYPGRYEIKFVVDGVWRVDPLRPIANNNGYENNVLIIHH